MNRQYIAHCKNFFVNTYQRSKLNVNADKMFLIGGVLNDETITTAMKTTSFSNLNFMSIFEKLKR